MTIPGKRRPSSAKRRRRSHHALKPKNLIRTTSGKAIPHSLMRAFKAGKSK